MIAIWVLVAVRDVFKLSETTLLAAGFILGVFPRILWQYLKMAVRGIPSIGSKLPISGLDGLTVWHEARLEEEDIENIPNMATADIVDLLLNTRLPPERILYWMDQAILYTALGTKKDGADGVRSKLSTQGIRTATTLLLAQKNGGVEKIPGLSAALTVNSNLKLILRWQEYYKKGRRQGDSADATEVTTAPRERIVA